jgi:hypothetical protein
VRYSTFKDLIATTTTYDDAVKIAEDYDVKNMLYDDGLGGRSVAKDHTFYVDDKDKVFADFAIRYSFKPIPYGRCGVYVTKE